MRYHYRIIKEHELIVEVITGEITIEELIRRTEHLMADPDFNPGFSGISDLRSASPCMTKVEIHGFANWIKRPGLVGVGRSKWSILANEPIILKLSHLFRRCILKDDTVGVFGTPKAAAHFIEKPQALLYLPDRQG